MLDRQDRRLLTNARTLGTGELSVVLSDNELLRLFVLIAHDLGRSDLVSDIAETLEMELDYYGTGLDWFRQPVASRCSMADAFLLLKQNISDFSTYLECLCSIHKRRLKFRSILERQAFPQMEQVVPRCLLEYGLRPSETLASWLVWRKWLYDVDNRSAQETGYLFEPILAAAIGGVPQSAKNSPIKRTGEPTKGRQVDCLDSNNKLAYEFKMRVTIASSGQGRFQEELDFARDCASSAFQPILLVLDPTPSTRLEDLADAYRIVGGTAFIGDLAWQHVEERAGTVMATFVEKYVRQPLLEVDKAHHALLPIELKVSEGAITCRIGSEEFRITRRGQEITVEEDEEEAAEE